MSSYFQVDVTIIDHLRFYFIYIYIYIYIYNYLSIHLSLSIYLYLSIYIFIYIYIYIYLYVDIDVCMCSYVQGQLRCQESDERAPESFPKDFRLKMVGCRLWLSYMCRARQRTWALLSTRKSSDWVPGMLVSVVGVAVI